MKKILVVIAFSFAIFGLIFFLWKSDDIQDDGESMIDEESPVMTEEKRVTQESENKEELIEPLDRAKERVTKKRFGTYVTPQNSPISPERFRGYHTALDFEVFPEELVEDVSVKAVCEGELLEKKDAQGYGGVIVMGCNLGNEEITVIYGHLDLMSVPFRIGEKVSLGETVGILGQGYSQETDNERKHLHLGFHRGENINILGYVQNRDDLSEWFDPYGF